MSKETKIWLILALWSISAVGFALTKSNFPFPNGGKAILRDELIRLSEP